MLRSTLLFVALLGITSATLLRGTTPATCCTPTGTFSCDGQCVVGTTLQPSPETDTLSTFGQDGVFVSNTIHGANGFVEVEYYTQVPGNCNAFTGLTYNRTDLPKGGQVFYEDVVFADDCSGYTKVVKGELPVPTVCSVKCTAGK